jgi:tetratricopeptide (TPR) repeat protein
MRFIAGLVLLFAAAVSAAAGQSVENEGLQALDQKDYPAAVRIFAKLAADDPKNFWAWFNLALAESAVGKDADSIEHYQRALEAKPDLYEARLNLGMLYFRDAKPAEAAVQLAEACRLKDDQFRPRLYLAESQLAAGQYKQAAASFEVAVKLDPKSARSELGWGQCLLRMNALDEAAAHYRRAADLDPALHSRQLELASAYAAAHRPIDAIAILKELPVEADTNQKLAELYMEAGQPERAAVEYEAVYYASPTRAHALALATAYIQSQQSKKALPLLDKALDEDPNDYDVQMAAGRISLQAHDYPKAAARFSAAAKIKPDLDTPWSELAAAATLAEQYPQALYALDQIHRLHAEKAGHFYFRAIILDKLKQVKPALENYRRFLELSKGEHPDEEFKARQRARILEHELTGR